eukprot:TRINITY_DN26226_c0_g1_i2.p1 TRINITY_DN26226_c0_g1~~TRINITY_DN26226_c0_g1_i2.p1  ORF type:complete len:297 (-),score=6.62 TRINITY_DN26226_c0_g1_i2:43-933(-)
MFLILLFLLFMSMAGKADRLLHQGNSFCWRGFQSPDNVFSYCCKDGGDGCWDEPHDHDACCLDPDENFFIPRHCHSVVFEWLGVGGSIGWTDQSRKSMSAYLREAGEFQLKKIMWALPSPGDLDKPLEILDLGAGLAKVDIALHRHFQGHAHFTFVDRSEIDAEGMWRVSVGLQRGYTQRHPFYGNLNCARDIAAMNGISDVRTLELSSDSQGLDQLPTESIDLIISLASWGYHYPISVHLRQVSRILRRHGVLIMTLRGWRTFLGLTALARSGFSCITRPDRSYNITKCMFTTLP